MTVKKYAQVIIDISRRGLDRPFTYRVPPALQEDLRAGSIVMVPFGAGNTLRKGYVIGFTGSADFEEDRIKEIAQCVEPARGYSVEDDSEYYLRLAAWMKDRYGSTMAAAMRTVLASRKGGKMRERRQIRLLLPQEEAERVLAEYDRRHQKARARLLKELLQAPVLPWTMVTQQLHVSSAAVQAMKRMGVVEIESVQELRNPVNVSASARTGMPLSPDQQRIVDTVLADFEALQEGRGESGDRPAADLNCGGSGDSVTGDLNCGGSGDSATGDLNCGGSGDSATGDLNCGGSGDSPTGDLKLRESGDRPFVSLIHGVTGSGKTEVYISIIRRICARGRQAIMLIPEIALTFQTLMRFYSHFGDRVSVVNSSLSDAERADQWERARRGEIDVIIGPRSALFTPFPNPGVIVIDEEHEHSYKNESMPKYQTREAAEEIARMHGAVLVLGSATPSLESYWRAQQGEIRLFRLRERLTGGTLPAVETVDMRRELSSGNRSILSRSLYEKIRTRLEAGQQSMLFINRRGYAGFVSCRSCGFVPKCPHCEVSLTLHAGGRLVCHYCGYERPAFRACPECGSRYILAMRAGTEQIEGVLQETFPNARILRMDADTTRKKGSYEKILSAFASEEADILLGTQMIVKGHDFPGVTLVGILMADMSLYGSDYRSAERTFQLLTQAAGRAGRGTEAGEVVIQTYQPDHYAIRHAARQDYEGFYREEIAYRRLMRYPPAAHMMAVQIQSEDEEAALHAANAVRQLLTAPAGRARTVNAGAYRSEPGKTGTEQIRPGNTGFGKKGACRPGPDNTEMGKTKPEAGNPEYQIIGPSEASLRKLRDMFRFVLYIKAEKYDTLIDCKNRIEKAEAAQKGGRDRTGKGSRRKTLAGGEQIHGEGASFLQAGQDFSQTGQGFSRTGQRISQDRNRGDGLPQAGRVPRWPENVEIQFDFDPVNPF